MDTTMTHQNKIEKNLTLGGYNYESESLSSCEILKPPSSSFVAGPDLPLKLGYPCMAAINTTHAILSGGYGNGFQKGTYLLNLVDNTLVEMANMEFER